MPVNAKFISLWLLLCLFWAGAAGANPQATAGLLDLSDWDFHRQGPVELDGDWQFFWGQHLDAELVRIQQLRGVEPDLMQVPGNWNDDDRYSNIGFATYRLEVLLAAPTELAVKLRTVGTAYRLIIDGRIVAEVGTAGQSEVTTTPKYRSQLIEFMPNTRRVEIIFQVSNFDHRNAGLWEAISLGTPETLQALRQSRLSLDLTLFGAIAMMAFFNLITWLTRRENTSGLWLGLFCLTLSSRILLVDDRYLSELLPTIPWSLEVRFEYIAWFLSVPIFLAFIRSMFPTEASQLVLRSLWGLAGLFVLLTIFLPIVQASSIVPAYQVLTLLGIAYGTYCTALAIIRRKEGSILFGVGSVFLFLAATSDIVTVAFTLDADHQLQVGLFIFVLLQSIQVSLRSSKAFQTVEAQSSELRKTNLELHIQEKLRRNAEGESQALHEQMNQAMRVASFGVVADAVAERGPEGSPLVVALQDVARLLRGDVTSGEAIHLDVVATEFFASEEFQQLKTDYPLVTFEQQFEATEGVFLGSLLQLKVLLFHLSRYGLRTQIQSQTVKISGRTDYIYAGSLFHHQVTDGDYYILSVEDQGQGIRPEDLVEIFDPSQKANGYVNMKLPLRDLAIAWTILENHGGALDVHSHSDSTRLELYFPLSDRESEGRA